ncbi:adenosylcobinamide amidohydrolase [Desulfolucanica intricata]|uniref:adenosylcobinamide amidohydrolase n=1 Tax=Desulfolucanica intricata TaxID=1285191 RepID=UPI0008321C80|nr:adenosylcobinamide amidohydrolase [Desulfolucanica intricata]
MIIHELSSGESVDLRNNSLVVSFPDRRNVVSTSKLNGGYREDIQAVYNHYIPPHIGHSCNLEGGSVDAYLKIHTERLGLSYEHSVGILTAARMENVSVKTRSFRDLQVTALITGGVEVNGGRAGDPAGYYEENSRWIKVGGTINTILIINADLPEATMVRAIMTATEAKSAALQELMAPSRYSKGIATGSGTDDIIVVANPLSPYRFEYAGKHSKLGELIGLVVKESTKEALEKQTGLNAERQCDVLERLTRYKIKENDFLQGIDEGINQDYFIRELKNIARDRQLVAITAALLHLLDEYSWGLLAADCVRTVGKKLLAQIGPIKRNVDFGLQVEEELLSDLVGIIKQKACMKG